MLAGLIGAAANVGFLLIAVVGLGLSQFIEGAADALRSTGLSEDWVAKLIGDDQSGWRLLMFVGATPALLTFFVRIFVPESKLWQHAARRMRRRPAFATSSSLASATRRFSAPAWAAWR